MNLHNLSCSLHVGYPVGEYLQEDLPKYKELAGEFIAVARKDVMDSKRVQLMARGSSGAIIGSIFLEALTKEFPGKGISLIYVKKRNEDSHHNSVYTATTDSEVLKVFVDDFIVSGDSIAEMIDQIRQITYIADYTFDWVVCTYVKQYAMDHILEVENITKNLLTEIR